MFDTKSRDIAIISGLGVLVLMVVGLAIMFAVQTAPHDVLEEVQAFRIEIRTEQHLLHEELNQRKTITDSIRNRQDVLSLRLEQQFNDRDETNRRLWQLIDSNQLTPPDSWERPKD